MQDNIENNLRAGHELSIHFSGTFWADMIIDHYYFMGVGSTVEGAIEDLAQCIAEGPMDEEDEH